VNFLNKGQEYCVARKNFIPYKRKNYCTKGLRKNNFAELAPRFRSDLAVPIEQNHRNSSTISRILRLRRGRRWPEAGMRKCGVVFAQALRGVWD